jgi:hypothetical protein
MKFRTALYNALNAAPTWEDGQNQLAAALSKPSVTNTALINFAEAHVKATLGIPPNASVDWSTGECVKMDGTKSATTINWATILADLEQFLPVLLQILMTIIPAL